MIIYSLLSICESTFSVLNRASYEDTYNTLKYADRAKSIRVRAERNEVNVNHHVSQYINIIEALRQEISELKGQVREADDKIVVASQQPMLVRETKEGLFEHHHLFAELLLEHQKTTLLLHKKGAELARLTLSLQVLAAVPGKELAGFGWFFSLSFYYSS